MSNTPVRFAPFPAYNPDDYEESTSDASVATCRYFLQGNCMYGVDCRESHGLEPMAASLMPPTFCFYWQNGFCRFGDRCKNFHRRDPSMPSPAKPPRMPLSPLSALTMQHMDVQSPSSPSTPTARAARTERLLFSPMYRLEIAEEEDAGISREESEELLALGVQASMAQSLGFQFREDREEVPEDTVEFDDGDANGYDGDANGYDDEGNAFEVVDMLEATTSFSTSHWASDSSDGEVDWSAVVA